MPIDSRHTEWLTLPLIQSTTGDQTQHLLSELNLETVCNSAHCPNISECFGHGTATFLILGNRCTRNCGFCAIDTGSPEPVQPDEPLRVAKAVRKLGLKYVVITSVTRDDLPDGGASHFVRTILEIRNCVPGVQVEILVPDFKADPDALVQICTVRPDMFNHNIETVPRLYPVVRPQAIFERSLDVLRRVAGAGIPVKSGVMVGLGETEDELFDTLAAIRETGCKYLTIGQYLSPSTDHLPVDRYFQPLEFDHFAEKARAIGFSRVASGPLVRSSYQAERMAVNSPNNS